MTPRQEVTEMVIEQTVSGGERKHFTTKETAALIRAAVKRAFPGVKFAVRTKYASMYAATYVRWTDGPTQAEVDMVANRFSSRSFDGSTDSTNYHEHIIDGQRVSYSGWISTTRDISPELHARALRVAALVGEENVWSILHNMRPNGVRVTLKSISAAGAL